MKPVLVPTTDVNSDKGLVMSWRTENKTRVEVGQPLIDIETSKALIEVDAAHAGFILQAVNAGDTASLAEPIGYVFEELADLERFEAELRKAREEAKLAASTATVRATQQARQRAEELGVDLSWLDTSKLITLKDVEAAAAQLTDYSTMPAPLTGSTGVQRVLLIGGALGATQVLDILQKSEMRKAVAILDDDRSKWGSDLQGVPMIGGTDRLPTLFAEKAFDAAIITIGTSINARVKFRELCAGAGIPLANAIGVGVGDEVITVSHSYIATANSVRYCGALPVFIDIDPQTYNMDPAKVEEAIGPQTRAPRPSGRVCNSPGNRPKRIQNSRNWPALCQHRPANDRQRHSHRQGGPLFFASSLIPLFLLLRWLRRAETHVKD